MKCENCQNGTMEKAVVNTIKGDGYTTLIKFICKECDFSFMKVA